MNLRKHITTHKKPENSLKSDDYINENQLAVFNKSSITTSLIIYIGMALFILLLFWARFCVIDEITVGSGKVVPSSQIQVIQSLEGGLLKKIYVHEGEHIKSGQTLLQLDDTQFSAQLGEERSRYLTTLASIARLKAEINDQNIIDFPKQLADYPNIRKTEEAVFNAELKAFHTSIKNLQKSYDYSLKELQITEPLVKKGVISTIELLRLQRETNDLKTKVDESKDKFKEQALSKLREKKAEISGLSEALKSDKDKVDRATIRSPVNGIIKQIYINTIGGVIKPGMPIMEIVPMDDSLMLEVRINPTDIAFIHPDQKAVVRITAYDYTLYGGLKGVVSHISADTSTDEQGHSYYEIFVKTNKAYLGSAANPMPIIPGMVASVNIMTGKRSLLAYLLKPILRAKGNAFRER